MKYGLIGKDVRNSFSKSIHEQIGYDYELISLKEEELEKFFKDKDFKGINVTIPYKQSVIKFLDYVSPSVEKIGVCNCIVNEDGLLKGYNTDYDGVMYLIKKNDFDFKNKNVLILGSGGTCKTVSCVLKDLFVKNIYVASRSPKENQYSYQDIYKLDVDFIVNTTPNGMIGYSDDILIDLSKFNKLEGVIDVIYNPLRTSLLNEANKLDIQNSNGLDMLIYQAIRASELFTNSKISDEVISKIKSKILLDKLNFVLIGLPGVGKTTLGKLVAEQFNKEFVDMDSLIVNKENMSIKEIFDKYGEAYFRNLESNLCKELESKNNLVISTGGGVILNKENVKSLAKNGLIIFLDKDLDLFTLSDERPLTKNKEELKKIRDLRYNLYLSSCDVLINLNNNLDKNIEKIMEVVYEIVNC